MSLDESTTETLADDLFAALRSGEPIAPLTDDHDLSIADAYGVQSAFLDRRLAEGASVVGHKIGLTSDGIQSQLGVDEPDFGRLLDTMRVEDGVVSTDELLAPRIEPEIGFVLADDLRAPVTELDVLQATRGVVPVAEIIDSRVRDWDIQIQDTVADNASAGLFATGPQLTDVSGLDLSLEGVKLYRNGDLAEAGVGANVLDHPATAVAWLANTLAEMDATLDAGDLVLSGSFVPAVDLAAGDAVTIEFSSLGTLSLRVD
ncbi:2-keto-4-pentenoate hydratase [Halobacteriales archaeon Cl-PHB]